MDVKRGINRICILVALVRGSIVAFIRRILSSGFLFSIFAIVGATFGGTHAVYRIGRWIHRGLTGQRGGGSA
jgi:hypothetical protein